MAKTELVAVLILVAMVMMVNSRSMTRKELRKLMMNRGLPIFKGNFIYERYTLSKAEDAAPQNNVRIFFHKGNYIYRDGDKRLCLMTANDATNTLTVIKSKRCPLAIGQFLKFNETGLTMPDGRFFDRNFNWTIGRKYCSLQDIKLLQCQKEDYNRTMLENARTSWDHNVWYDYGNFLQKHLCICNMKARYGFFPFFAVTYYGQCQGVDQIGVKTDTGCVNGAYKTCVIGKDKTCAGKAGYDALYQVIYEDDGSNINVNFDDDTEKDEKPEPILEDENYITNVWKDFNLRSGESDQFHMKRDLF